VPASTRRSRRSTAPRRFPSVNDSRSSSAKPHERDTKDRLRSYSHWGANHYRLYPPPGRTCLPEAPIDAVDANDADRKVVEEERAELRKFITGLSPDDIKSGGWFTKLRAQA